MTTFSAMAYAPGGSGARLVQVSGVTGPFPFYGEIVTQPATAWETLSRGPNTHRRSFTPRSPRRPDRRLARDRERTVRHQRHRHPHAGGRGHALGTGPARVHSRPVRRLDRAACLWRQDPAGGVHPASRRPGGPAHRRPLPRAAPRRQRAHPDRGREPAEPRQCARPPRPLPGPRGTHRTAPRRTRCRQRHARVRAAESGNHRRAPLPRRDGGRRVRDLRGAGRHHGPPRKRRRSGHRRSRPAGAAVGHRVGAAVRRVDGTVLAGGGHRHWYRGVGRGRVCAAAAPVRPADPAACRAAPGLRARPEEPRAAEAAGARPPGREHSRAVGASGRQLPRRRRLRGRHWRISRRPRACGVGADACGGPMVSASLAVRVAAGARQPPPARQPDDGRRALARLRRVSPGDALPGAVQPARGAAAHRRPVAAQPHLLRHSAGAGRSRHAGHPRGRLSRDGAGAHRADAHPVDPGPGGVTDRGRYRAPEPPAAGRRRLGTPARVPLHVPRHGSCIREGDRGAMVARPASGPWSGARLHRS